MDNKKLTLSDKEHLEFQKFVEDCSYEIMKKLYLLNYTVTFSYNMKKKSDKHGNIIFSTKSNSVYKQISIVAHSEAIRMYIEDDRYKLFRSLTHEFCHVFSNNIFNLAKDRYVTERELINNLEELTQNISNLVENNLYDGYMELTKKELINTASKKEVPTKKKTAKKK